ncbi:MAG: MlaD family protein [Myxococcota bacterium]
MSRAGRDEGDDVGDAIVEEQKRVSAIWIIPIIALLVGGFVAWRVLSARGPEIEISFKSAEGLQAGKTQVKYKDVEIGLVESVELTSDLTGVVVTARMVAGARDYLREKARFWIVKPRIAGGQVSGLGTLLSGAYIGMDPVLEGKRATKFTGLEVPPIVTLQAEGKYFVLRSRRAGAIDVGTPVFFRKIAVGQVVSSALDATDDFVTTRIFVRAPYDERVHAVSRFWDASGFNATVSADGVVIDTESIISILVGGIAFDAVNDEGEPPAAAETVFTLYESREAANRPVYTQTTSYLLYFEQSVRGLRPGAAVEFRGIEVGEVTDVRLEFDAKQANFRIPVTIEIEPERFTSGTLTAIERRANLDKLVASGMRAQLKSGNLLTGQLIVALDIFKNAAPANVDWSGPLAVIPTVPTPIEEITASLTTLAEKLGKLPVEQIGEDLKGSLAALRATLAKAEGVGPALTDTLRQAERTLSSTDALIGPDSTVNAELRRTLLELSEAARALGLAAEQIQTQPQSLIFGKEGTE